VDLAQGVQENSECKNRTSWENVDFGNRKIINWEFIIKRTSIRPRDIIIGRAYF